MQLISITSEALQATIRRLLPSQAGFSEDLEAVNTIQPIIDLTRTAEGTQLPVQLQQAFDFVNTQNVDDNGSTQVLSVTPGFYRVAVTITIETLTTGTGTNALMGINDGASTKKIIETSAAEQSGATVSNFYDVIFYVQTGQTIVASADVDCVIVGTLRQVADVYGNLVNPGGFTFE